MRLGKVPLAPDIEQVLDSVKIKEESVAAAAGEEGVVARLDDVRRGAERDLRVRDYLRPHRFDRARVRTFGQEHVEGLLAVLRRRKHEAERDIRQQIAVIIDIDAVDGVGMERVGIGIRVEYDARFCPNRSATGTRRGRIGRVAGLRAAVRGLGR